MDKDYRRFSLWLYLKEGYGNVKIKKLLDKFKNITNMYSFFEGEYTRNSGSTDTDGLVDVLNKLAIEYIFSWEVSYPVKLREIYDNPFVIFYKGEFEVQKFEKCISVVGTRNLTSYGKKYAYEISYDLAKKGFSIVSGLANGIDSIAHQASLDAGGITIAVLAGSVAKSIPSSNWQLYERILENGGIVLSEYSPRIVINPGLFASRNRIVAGLSMGTVIIEAPEKSGALITADLALNYNRDVFAMPGSVNSPKSKGCNQLIRDSKAKLIQSADDILAEYGYTPTMIKNEEELKLSSEEKKIYDILLGGEKNIEEISKALNMGLNNVISLSLNLELQGYIKKDFIGKYSLIK